MEMIMDSSLEHSGYNNENSIHKRVPIWRPWTQEPGVESTDFHETCDKALVESTDVKKPNNFVHPVKLFWPRSRCYDYLYQDAEVLLRNYPVQATICFYADSSSDEEDSDEEDEKEMN